MTNAVFYGFQFPHHGRFSAFSALSREFEKTDVEVCRMSYPRVPAWMPKRIKGICRKKWFQLNEYRLKSAFRAGKLVHYFFPENSLFKAPVWKRDGTLVLSCHQPVEQLMKETLLQKRKYLFQGLKTADAVILMASSEIEAYRELAPNGRVLCIPHGVDTDFFAPRQDVRKPDERFRVLTVGNWLRDYELWAETVKRIYTDGHAIEFTVIANPDTLKAALGTLGSAANQVRVLSRITDEQLRDEYRRADVIFLPLKNTWANNALLEGMSCGRPPVVTDLPAAREYAGDAACFIEKGSVDSAADALLRMRANKTDREELGRKARERMENQYSWAAVVRQYLDLYAGLSSQ